MIEPKWVTAARAEIGQREGTKDDPHIAAYRVAAGCDWVKGSCEVVPWCAIFVNAMLAAAGVKGTASPAAKSFCSSHDFQPLGHPALGAITVIERNPPVAWQGHVGFCVGADTTHIWLLAGNQGDAVDIARFERSRVRGFYWPTGQAAPTCGNFRYAGTAAEGGKVA